MNEQKGKITLEHFEKIDLNDCDVPIGCPLGLDCPEDSFPDHHGGGPPYLRTCVPITISK